MARPAGGAGTSAGGTAGRAGSPGRSGWRGRRSGPVTSAALSAIGASASEAVGREEAVRPVRVVVTNSVLHRTYGGHLIPCGVDHRRFRPGPRPARREPVAVVTVGEDRPEKQFWLASAAAAWAREAGGPAFEHRFVSRVHPKDM